MRASRLLLCGALLSLGCIAAHVGARVRGSLGVEGVGDVEVDVQAPPALLVPLPGGGSVTLVSTPTTIDVGDGRVTQRDVMLALQAAGDVAKSLNLTLSRALDLGSAAGIAAVSAGLVTQEQVALLQLLAAVVANEAIVETSGGGVAQVVVPPGETPGLRTPDASISWSTAAGCTGPTLSVTGPVGFCNIVPDSALVAAYRVVCDPSGGQGVFQACLRVSGTFTCEQCIDAVSFTSGVCNAVPDITGFQSAAIDCRPTLPLIAPPPPFGACRGAPCGRQRGATHTDTISSLPLPSPPLQANAS